MAPERGAAGARTETLAEPVRAVVYRPGSGEYGMEDVPGPRREAGVVRVRTLIAGVDGTDEEVVAGEHGEAPEGEDRLVLGHEALGEVIDAPPDSGFEPGDRVLPLVRPGCGRCPQCRAGAADLCPTDAFREHGIKGLHGFMRDEWAVSPETLVKAPKHLAQFAVLTEPLSIVVKALETARLIQSRIPWFDDEGGFRGQRALLAGTGSLGSLGAFLLRHEGMEVWAMDRTADDAPTSRFLRDVGVHHVNAKEQDVADVARDVDGFDLVIEATGVPGVVFDTVKTLRKNGVMGMLGVTAEGEPLAVDADGIMRRMVLGNQVLFGSVNSNRHHFEEALRRLSAFRARWGDTFEGIITHTFPRDQYRDAFERHDDTVIKKVIDWQAAD